MPTKAQIKARSKAREEAYAKELRKIADRYDKLEAAEVKRQLAMLKNLRNAIAGEVSDVSDFESLRLKTLQKNIDKLIAEYSGKAAASIELGVNGSHQQGSLFATEPLEAIGIDTSWFKPSKAQINVLTDMSADLITNIGEDLRKDVNTQIRMAALGERTPFDAMKDITKLLGAPSKPTDRAKGVAYRAEMITRTEMNRAFSLANFSGQQQAGEKIDGLQKKWMSTADGRTRATHLSAHGQIKPVKEPFVVGDAELMYPHDPNGTAKETINCRCRSVTVIPEVGDIETPLDAQIEKERAKRDEEEPKAKVKPKEVVVPSIERERFRRFDASYGDGEKDIDNWADGASYAGWNAALSDKEREWLKEYKQDGFEWINSGLRGNFERLDEDDYYTRADFKEATKAMDDAIRQHRLPNDVTLWRGGSHPELTKALKSGRNLEDLSGMIIGDDAYMSTSLNSGSADDFVKWAGKDGFKFEIQAPRGTHGAYIEYMDPGLKEYEYLLARGSKLEILEANMQDGVQHVVARVLPL